MTQKIIYKGMKFDDFVSDETGIWSEICEDCLKRYGLRAGTGEVSDFGSGVCGVEGCVNSPEDGVDTYYIDFESEITYVEEE